MKHCSKTFSFLEHVVIKFMVHLQSSRAWIIVNLLMNQSSVPQVCAQCQHNQGSNCWQQKNCVTDWTTHYTFSVRNSGSERTCLWRKPDKTQLSLSIFTLLPSGSRLKCFWCCITRLQSNILPQADASEFIPHIWFVVWIFGFFLLDHYLFIGVLNS